MVASHARVDRRFTGRGLASVPTAARFLRYQWYRAQLPRLPVARAPFVPRRTDCRGLRRGALRPVAREGAHDPRAARSGRAAPQRRPAATQGLRRPLPTPPRHDPPRTRLAVFAQGIADPRISEAVAPGRDYLVEILTDAATVASMVADSWGDTSREAEFRTRRQLAPSPHSRRPAGRQRRHAPQWEKRTLP